MTFLSRLQIGGFAADDPGMLDATNTEFVEVIVDNDRLWINIDGISRLRAAIAPGFEITLTGSHKNIHRLGARKRAPTTEEDTKA